MAQTVAHLYDSYEAATAVVNRLEAAGISHSEISIVAHDSNTAGTTRAPVEHGSGAAAGAGASLGTVVGGGVGLLAGIGSLAIPGVGPVIAAGWLVATLTGAGIGAAAGGLLGSLTGAGVHRDRAEVYSEGVRRGGTLVTVRADDTQAPTVESMMAEGRPVDWQQRGATYRAGGWGAYDPNAPAYSPAEAQAERDRLREGM